MKRNEKIIFVVLILIVCAALTISSYYWNNIKVLGIAKDLSFTLSIAISFTLNFNVNVNSNNTTITFQKLSHTEQMMVAELKELLNIMEKRIKDEEYYSERKNSCIISEISTIATELDSSKYSFKDEGINNTVREIKLLVEKMKLCCSGNVSDSGIYSDEIVDVNYFELRDTLKKTIESFNKLVAERI